MTRRRLTRAERATLLWAQGYLCACGCGCPLWPGAHVEYDHVLPLGLGGGNDFPNWDALTRHCHARKTRGDKARMDKAERQGQRTGPQKPGRKRARIPGRGFRGSRKFDGSLRWKT